MAEHSYIHSSREILQELKVLCAQVPETSTLQQQYRQYEDKITQFTDNLLLIMERENHNIELLFPLCNEGEYEGCNKTLLGEKLYHPKLKTIYINV